ncbi:hypothetical protein DSO57_1023147 [Entomophthora muscae]|uniref:Uncharacterized protein n=1 Tax=Entomophthora muscae TaxID=34485 RepID=A0ACC2RHK6_9FUNG|nr:hypothetical protein DSO57_1023147 [Entomophthora muscae]
MKEIPTAPPLPNAPPTQDFSKLGFVCITILGLANQVVPHTGSWRPLATALNYLVQIASIVHMAFQARPASPVGAQPDSDMGRDMFPGLDKIMQGYAGSLNGEASVYGHSQPTDPSTSPTQECVLSPATSSMTLFAHHAQAAANPNPVSTMASGTSHLSHGVTQ